MLKNSIEVRAGLARLLDPPMDLTRIEAPDFDLAMTLNSGQVFHWEKIGDGFCGMIGDRAVYVEQRGDILKVRFGETQSSAATQGRRALFRARSSTRRNLRVVPARPGHGCGARFLSRPSDYSPAKMGMPGHLYLFFDETGGAHPANLAGVAPAIWAKETNLRTGSVFISVARRGWPGRRRESCENAGWVIARRICWQQRSASRPERRISNSWRALSERQLREQLCELPGVGMKVANCVMLFAYERIAAFPIDVWIERVLRERYFVRGRKVTSEAMAEFVANYFGAHGGYAQQYLFHHARMTGKRKSRTHSID